MAQKRRFCQRCQAEIPARRIEAIPETRLCVNCSQKVGGDFRYSVVTAGQSKGGLKITGFDIVEIKKKRKPISRIQE